MKPLLYVGLLMLAFQSRAQVDDFKDINFTLADNKALECRHEGLNNLPELSHKLTESLNTDVEKFRAIYRWVSGNIANDYAHYEKNSHKRQRFKNDSVKLKAWNNKFRKQSFKALRDHQKATCTGYAYLVKELSRLSNITCEVVNGYAKTSTIDLETLGDMPNHSWNAVLLNGEWYLCDPTWASGLPNPETFQFEFNYNDGYFLASPELFAVNHYPTDPKWLLLPKEAPSFENFLDNPIIYGKTYKYLSALTAPPKMHNIIQQHDVVVFECELLKSVNPSDIMLIINSGNISTEIHPKNIKIDGSSLRISHKFDSRGFFDAHLYFASDLIATYTFRVKG